MEIKLEKQPLKTAIVCLGNRISLTAKNVRSVDLEYLREYILKILGRAEVDFVSKKTSKEKDITFFKDIFSTDLNDYDEIFIYNAPYNLFGGVISDEQIELMKKLYSYEKGGKMWYVLADPKMPYRCFANFLLPRVKADKLKYEKNSAAEKLTEEWLSDWSKKVSSKIDIAFTGKDYDKYFNLYVNGKEDNNFTVYKNLNPDYDWFFLKLFEYYSVKEEIDLKLQDYDYSEKEYDIVYFGNNRQNERNKIIKKLLNNAEIKKLFIGFDPELENCDSLDYVKHSELFPLIGKKCFSTVILVDNLHNGNIKTARFFESMLLDTVAFISTTYDPDKEFITNEFLKDFIYISDSNELNEKIKLIKSDKELYKKIVKLEREEILNQNAEFMK